MTHILLVAPMDINQERAGPAIRFWEFARVLSAEHTVTLLVRNQDHPSHPDLTVVSYGQAGAEEELDSLLARQQVVMVQGPAIQRHPHLAQILAAGQHHLVVDLYDPITLEHLFMDMEDEQRRLLHLEYWALLNEQLHLGDFFLCANERQRDYWLGALTALGRINYDTLERSAGRGDMRQLIDVVPFGLPGQPPRPGGPTLKGVVPGIAADDRVILWGGGLWDWLDPLTPVRAMHRVAARHPGARLVFFDSPRSPMATFARTRQFATDEGLLGRTVLFAQWLPPEQWEACLLEADIGLSFHPASVETHFAFRTRLLDYLWAGLPIVTAKGDTLSELVARHNLGYVVEPGDVEGLAEALIALLDEPDPRQGRQAAFRQLAEQFTWERAAAPLLHYCREPWHAGDTGPSFVKRWQEADHDRLLAQAAMLERRWVETQPYVRGLSWQLEQSEARFRAAMNGRVMRLMTGAQRTLQRLRGNSE